MPIVNGTYQSTPLFSYNGTDGLYGRAIQQQVFGDWTSRDMNDFTAAALNRLQNEQDKAFQVEMWNLQNQYNTPSAQMQRYKDAGLNPNLIYSQANAAAPFSQPSSHAATPTHGSSMNNFQKAMSFLSQIRSLADSAAGINEAFSRNSLRMHQQMAVDQQGSLNSYRAMQMMYLLGLAGDDPESTLFNSPFANRYRAQTNLTESQSNLNLERIDQIQAMVDMIPDQRARLRALTALDEYRLKIIEGQNDAILNINTGSNVWDAILKLLIYTGKDNIGGILHLL